MNQESNHGWTRELHFHDKRTPEEIKAALERDLMVLFTPGLLGAQLRLSATASVNGARYDFELRFIAALESYNHYALIVTAEWPAGEPAHQEYFRKSSDGWYQMWTRGLTPVTGSPMHENLEARYAELCNAVLQAEPEMQTVAAVQQQIVEGMKRGGSFGAAHKEGGTNIYWRDGKFIRSDYGDNPGVRTYTSEAELLQMLRLFCQFDVTRAAGNQKVSELDAWKLILRRMSHSTTPPPLGGGGGGSSAVIGIVATLLLFLVGGGMAAWKFLAIESTGVPLGLAARSPTHVLQLIMTTERYLPSLHRAPGRDRYRIDLLAISMADPSKQEVFPLLRQQLSNVSTPMTKILGVEGDVVWVQALSTFAVNLRTKRVAREEDLRKANPELELFLASARGEFTDRFVAVSPDWSQAYSFSGETLKASVCPPPPRDGASWIAEQSNGRIERSLCSGGLLSASDWMSVETKEEGMSDFKPGSSLPRDFTAGEKDQKVVLLAGKANTNGQRARVESVKQVEETEYRQANFLRSKPAGSIFQTAASSGVFLLHRMGSDYLAPLSISRLDSNGRSVWSSATGIGRLIQSLPGEQVIALIGERTPVPNQVPEPILVVVDVSSGNSKAVSLWQKP